MLDQAALRGGALDQQAAAPAIARAFRETNTRPDRASWLPRFPGFQTRSARWLGGTVALCPSSGAAARSPFMRGIIRSVTMTWAGKWRVSPAPPGRHRPFPPCNPTRAIIPARAVRWLSSSSTTSTRVRPVPVVILLFIVPAVACFGVGSWLGHAIMHRMQVRQSLQRRPDRLRADAILAAAVAAYCLGTSDPPPVPLGSLCSCQPSSCCSLRFAIFAAAPLL